MLWKMPDFSYFSYADAFVAVREDLQAAHRRAWQRLARAGAWWSGAERVAIAAEVRNAPACALCGERKEALSPLAVAGEHARVSDLSEAVVEAVHQITNDPGRLSRAWFEKTLAGGLADGQYVEILGTVVTVVSIDAFARGLGVPPRPLPKPEDGEPTRYRPASAVLDEAWVPMIPNGAAKGPEQGLFGPAGRQGNVIRAMSLVPDEVRGLLDLSAAHYMLPEQMLDLRTGRTLDRSQIELLAGRVSALRECFY